MKSINYGRQSISEDDIAAVVAALKSDFMTQGPMVEAFENDFNKVVDSTYSIAVSNGTTALHLCAAALGVKPGSKVLVSAITFAASANCIRYCGGDVEFVDLDPKTLCLDISSLEKKLEASSGKYAGIVAVDFAGYPLDMERISAAAKKHGAWIIEDSCHAPGAAFKDSKGQWQKAGSGAFADLSIFSFHPVKHIATGEGGMITTRNKNLAEKIRLLRSHGITKTPATYDQAMLELGYNYRIPDVLCALGKSQLKHFDLNLKRRREIADKYFKELKGLPITLPTVPENVQHAYHLFVIRTSKRKDLYEFLKTHNIFTQVHYIPVYQHPYYKKLYGEIHLTESDKYYSECLSIPMFHSMTDDEQNFVIEKIKEFYV